MKKISKINDVAEILRNIYFGPLTSKIKQIIRFVSVPQFFSNSILA
jgi:hypothetical protein